MHKFWQFFDQLPAIAVGVGTASVVNRSLDTAVAKALAAHPNSKPWKALKKTLDVSDSILQWTSDTLIKIIQRKNEVPR